MYIEQEAQTNNPHPTLATTWTKYATLTEQQACKARDFHTTTYLCSAAIRCAHQWHT
jgi:hypothetical protein